MLSFQSLQEDSNHSAVIPPRRRYQVSNPYRKILTAEKASKLNTGARGFQSLQEDSNLEDP